MSIVSPAAQEVYVLDAAVISKSEIETLSLLVVASPSKIVTEVGLFLTTLALPVALLVIEKLGVLTVRSAILIDPAT
jgi:hypothetical protein